MKRILVPIDFSDAAEKVINQTKKFAQTFDGKVMLIHVASPEPDFIGDEVGPQVIRDQKAEKIKSEHQKIQQFAKELQESDIEAIPLLVQGVIVDEIIKESKKYKADLIIMGSHGHSAMYNLLMGSVVEGVIRESDIPVLVVPIKKS